MNEFRHIFKAKRVRKLKKKCICCNKLPSTCLELRTMDFQIKQRNFVKLKAFRVYLGVVVHFCNIWCILYNSRDGQDDIYYFFS